MGIEGGVGLGLDDGLEFPRGREGELVAVALEGKGYAELGGRRAAAVAAAQVLVYGLGQLRDYARVLDLEDPRAKRVCGFRNRQAFAKR